MPLADILLPLAVDVCYTYEIPADMHVAEGCWVEVSLGKQVLKGIVWRIRVPQDHAPTQYKIKPILQVIAYPPLDSKLREFIDWVARWTLAPLGMVLRMAIHARDYAPAVAQHTFYHLTGAQPLRVTPARQRVLQQFEDAPELEKQQLLAQAACSSSVLDGLLKEGVLAPNIVTQQRVPVFPVPDPHSSPPHLEPDQFEAAMQMHHSLKADKFEVTLLEGITGSGKTEVYFDTVAHALEAGKQVLIMMPEIALTTQFMARFAKRFGVPPQQWHSNMTPRRRGEIWDGVASGEIRVVAGARSALFLPYKELGLIIVDEEHESAYKQEEGVIYHARDMAVVRARLLQIPIILASATPSLETRVNASQGRYAHVRLTSRFATSQLPQIKAIDLRQDAPPRGSWISPILVQEITEEIAKGNQALLFMNRRGYAPLTLCRGCGHRLQCPHCTAWLVEHRAKKIWVCHHCGHTSPKTNVCPSCHAQDSLVACGPGIERIAEETKVLFPEARVLTLSSDAAGGSEKMREDLEKITQGDCDIIIGTQLIAKGLHFPHLTLVGVLDGDLTQGISDPRAAERTFQLLQQVIGRAGRAEKAGRAFIQTYQPDHPVIAALLTGQTERFYEQETQIRARGLLPPFGRLAALIVSGKDKKQVQMHAQALARAAYQLPNDAPWRIAPDGLLREAGEVALLGPVEAPLAMIRGRYRFRLLLRAARQTDLQGLVHEMMALAPKCKGDVRVQVDIDPQSFF